VTLLGGRRKGVIKRLYVDYYYSRQEAMWRAQRARDAARAHECLRHAGLRGGPGARAGLCAPGMPNQPPTAPACPLVPISTCCIREGGSGLSHQTCA